MMGRKKKKVNKKRKGNFLKYFLAIVSVVAVICFLTIPSLIYQSRRVPDLNEENLVTSLPDDILKILGTKTGPNAFKEAPMRVPILLYHYVEYVQDKNDTTRQSLNIPPNILTAQIETLKDAGYNFITPSYLTRALSGNLSFPKKPVILSFDDGYMDFYTDVFPILKKEKVAAVSYIIPNFLDRPNYMFTYELREVAKSPLVEIGAHTMNHAWLKGIDEKTAAYEISESKKVLEKMLGIPIESFAYPYGALDLKTVNLVEKSGFTNAVSTVPGIEQSPQNKYFFYRLRPGGRTGKALLDFFSQDTFGPW